MTIIPNLTKSWRMCSFIAGGRKKWWRTRVDLINQHGISEFRKLAPWYDGACRIEAGEGVLGGINHIDTILLQWTDRWWIISVPYIHLWTNLIRIYLHGVCNTIHQRSFVFTIRRRDGGFLFLYPVQESMPSGNLLSQISQLFPILL